MTGKENPHAREFKVQIEDVIVAGIVKSYILICLRIQREKN